MISVRLATIGEIGLAAYHVEKEKVDIYAVGRADFSYVMLDDEQPYGLVQFYRGHGPHHVAGLSCITFGLKGTTKVQVPAAIEQYRDLCPFISRIEAYTAEDNVPARKGLERIGFELEGILHGWYPGSEKAVNAALYAKVY